MRMIQKLLTLQEHDLRIREMKGELEDIPARKARESERLEVHRESVKQAGQRVEEKQAEVKAVELEIASRREKITKLRQQQYELKTNKEFKAMEEEILLVEKEIRDLEDKELLLMEETEKIKMDVVEKKKAVEKEEALISDEVKALDERVKAVEQELARVEEERKGAASGIDSVWMDRYQNIIDRKDIAVVELTDGICGGCHMKLPPSVGHDTKKQSEPVSCPYCLRLLY